jgi:hypothetical protein
MIERDDYRVALILPQQRKVLAIQIGGTLTLPHVSIPAWTRAAEQLTTIIAERWLLKSVVIDCLADSSMASPCAVIEIYSTGTSFGTESFVLADVDQIGIAELGETERSELKAILSDAPNNRGPLSKIGWIREAQAWIQSSVGSHEIEFTDDIRQLNGGDTFALIRFGTRKGPAYWLKAVGEPNLHELEITSCLAQIGQKYLPPFVSSRQDWHAWAMEEVGEDLSKSPTFDSCARTVNTLAQLQMQFLGKQDALLGCGCADHRGETLLSHLDDYFDYAVQAMEMQISQKVVRLAKSRIFELREIVRAAIERLLVVAVPDSLHHNDMSLGCVLSDGVRLVFTDWSEACVGNPSLTFELFRATLRRDVAASVAWAPELCTRYQKAWSTVLDERAMNEMLILSPILTIYSHFYSRGPDWTLGRRDDPGFQRRTRSLIRHLDRAAAELIPQKPECL